MVCQACGSEMAGAEARFCPRCGAQVVAVPAGPPPPQQQYAGYPPYAQYPPMVAAPRVQRHLQTLGTLWCVYGVYRFLAGFAGMFFLRAFAWRHFGGFGPFGMHGPGWMGLLPVIATVTVVMAGLALLVGYGLLTRKPWGRTLAIVIAILSLFRIPVGTGLGIYTLWVLAPGFSGAEYDAIADRS